MERIDFEQNKINQRKMQTAVIGGLISSISLAVIKFTLGIIGNSYTVVADGVESLSDTLSDLMLLLGIKLWNAPADENHPYGHLRIEAMITAFVGFMLFVGACFITYRAVLGIIEGKRTEIVGGVALIAPIAAIIVKECIYRWTIGISKRIKSSALYASAWHHRSDAITSVVSLVAVFIATLSPSFYIVDNIGGIICSILILRISAKIVIPALSELSDSGASEKIRILIENTAAEIENVKSVHKVRTRKMGSCIFADLHVLVDGSITVKNGHDIADHVQDKLISTIPDLIDVVVHIEPYEVHSRK